MSFYLWKKNESKRLIGRLSFMNVWKLTYCTIKFFTAKLYENTYFHILNITHACRKNNQITATFMENQGNTFIITKKWKLINMHWCSLKTDCTIKLFTSKLYENTPLHNFNVTHASRKIHQETITFMENKEYSLINTEKMKIDGHELVIIKIKLHN